MLWVAQSESCFLKNLSNERALCFRNQDFWQHVFATRAAGLPQRARPSDVADCKVESHASIGASGATPGEVQVWILAHSTALNGPVRLSASSGQPASDPETCPAVVTTYSVIWLLASSCD